MRIVITGCSSGFGLGATRLLAEAGHTIYATVRSPEAAVDLRELCDSGLPIIIETLDVRDAGQAKNVIDRAIREGGIDALVNNAGASLFAAIENMSIAQMRDLMETNVFGPVGLIQLVLPHMRERRRGRLINVSSASGIAPLPYLGPYSATKHALDAMSFSLAAELRDFDIHVTVISPGGFGTAISAKLWHPDRESDEPTYKAKAKAFEAALLSGHQANDPIIVSQAIVDTLHSSSPPVRLFVGNDAIELDKMRRTVSDRAWLEQMIAFADV